MSRTSARICAFKMIYEFLSHSDIDYELSLSSILDCESGELVLDGDDNDYIRTAFLTVREHLEEINNKIRLNLSSGKTIDDIFSIDLALISLAIAEIDYLNEDKSLVFNEVVRLAKKYSTDRSYAFVNGLLSSIYSE